MLKYRQALLVFGLYLALTVVMTWPVSVHPSGVRMGGGADPSLYVWTIGWGAHALTHAPWAAFDANIFFPFKHTLAYSENLLGSALLAIPIMWVTGDPLTATNLVAVLSVLLCGLGGYFLARTLGLSPAASVLCGLIFAFSPPRFARLSQLHLTAVQWVPFGLAFLHRYLDHGRPSDLRWLLGMLSLQALASGHGAALLVLGSAVILTFRLAGGWPLAPLSRLRDAGWPGLLLLAPAILAFIPYWLAKQDVALERIHDDVGVSLSSWISSPTHVHQWLLNLLPDWAWLDVPPDVFLFPGIIALLLAGVALARARPVTTAPRWVYLTMGLMTVWMTVGPPWSIWRWIYWLPGLNFIRVPSRFTMLGVLAIGVLAAIGFDRWAGAWPARRRALAAGVLATLMVAEFAMFPVDARPFDINTAAIDRWLDTQPKPFAIAEVPVSTSVDAPRRAEVATMYMLHSLAHHQPTVFGYSGAEPDSYQGLYDQLIAFPADATIDRLVDLGVTYVVVHLEYFTDEFRPEYEAALAAQPRLTLVHEEGLGRVYRLPAR
jgi:hypothetical protein